MNKPDIEKLAREARKTWCEVRGVKEDPWDRCMPIYQNAWKGAICTVLDKLNQPETPTLTREEHLKRMARAENNNTTGLWWQRIRCAMKSQWIPVGQYVPEPGESLLVRRKTESVEEAQFDGTDFHEHDRPDRIIPLDRISHWTYQYGPNEPEEQQ